MDMIQWAGNGTVSGFWDFVNVRQAMWERRHIRRYTPDQWTYDSILKSNRFCNVYRELDYGTAWAMMMIINPNRKNPAQMLYQTVLYRLLNRPETFEQIGLPGMLPRLNDDEDYRIFKEQLRAREDLGDRIWSTAYATCTPRDSSEPSKGSRLRNYFRAVDQVREMAHALTVNVFLAETLEEAWKEIQAIYCVGGFVGYEIMMDLMYSGRLPFTENDFVYIGPGALGGLQLIYGRLKPSEAQDRLYDLWSDQSRFDVRWEDRMLTKANIEQSLCEYRKYFSLTVGRGKKRTYQPRPEPDWYSRALRLFR